ncbi:hypothetical protein RFI_13993 [Reticulomyxa filosa]|uniref:Uncharacterized protein n=1 Tax=Reticulomyxa filosa TaxID=46433 RepID=X6NBB7_RETFI|nr:hypothetical protein RFI_13993 [Reticulomyxa filosa]|eukprot:ETO23193.1 hypothetical protein RFI_13993 [Reticulomyxa filosa]
MVFDSCLDMLLVLDEYWQGRLLIIEEILISYDIYYVKMCRLLYALGYQFFDPRSLVINGLRDEMGRLAAHNPDRFVRFAPYFLQELYPLFSSFSFFFLKKNFAKKDKSRNTFLFVFVDTITKSLITKKYFVHVKPFVLFSLEYSYEKFLKPSVLPENEKLLNDIDISIRRAVTGATAETRNNGYQALLIYERIAPTRAKDIISKMSTAVKRKYDQYLFLFGRGKYKFNIMSNIETRFFKNTSTHSFNYFKFCLNSSDSEEKRNIIQKEIYSTKDKINKNKYNLC